MSRTSNARDVAWACKWISMCLSNLCVCLYALKCVDIYVSSRAPRDPTARTTRRERRASWRNRKSLSAAGLLSMGVVGGGCCGVLSECRERAACSTRHPRRMRDGHRRRKSAEKRADRVSCKCGCRHSCLFGSLHALLPQHLRAHHSYNYITHIRYFLLSPFNNAGRSGRAE